MTKKPVIYTKPALIAKLKEISEMGFIPNARKGNAGGIGNTLEESGYRTLSGLATLIPVFTLVAYFFIGQTQGSMAVSQHAKWVLVGTLVSWVPYMLVVAYLSPKIGSHNAILLGLAVFLVLALIYIAIIKTI